MKFSAAQNKAIFAQGDSLLVSAAAGSGKTAVLVQRVIEKILNGADIDRMLIVTFTSAAASEMRQKIEEAIERQLDIEPNNEHLRRQALLIGGADISTVHAACKKILEQNFEAAGIDPSAVIGEESVLDILFDTLVEDFAEEIYQRAESDAELDAFVDFFGGGRSDAKLLKVLKSAYEYAMEQPFVGQIRVPSVDSVFDLFGKDRLYTYILHALESARELYRYNLYQPCMAPLNGTKLWQAMEREYGALQEAEKALERRDFDKTAEIICSISFARWDTRGNAYKEYPELCAVAKEKRTSAKETLTALQKKIFAKSEQEHLSDLHKSERIVTVLFSLVEELESRFAALKKERRLLSFDDLEHAALKVLIERYDPATDSFTPSAAALSLQAEYDEIIVDEYQDTNRKQDLIFRALSRQEKNIFMVGDMKQSIYRFRQACPELFAQKRKSSHPMGAEYRLQAPSYLYLNQNYRSHPKILDFANAVFSETMSEQLGQVDYNENERLNPGGLYPDGTEGHVEIDLIVQPETGGENQLSNIEAEAEYVADKIISLRGQKFYDVKHNTERPLEYGDMAILCRTASGVAGFFEQALRRRGIGCVNNNQDQQFLDVWEVKMLRAFLQVINNPYRDIPLITLMYSDFYAFSAKQLAVIRAGNKNVPFYDAVRLAAKEDGKCADMLRQIERLRQESVGKRTYEVLESIFAETFILEKIARYPDGQTRVANMRLMMRYAMDYEKDTYKGLFAFLNYLDKMSALGKILPGAGQAENAAQSVTLLSVHKSKGLEFPVCFLVNAAKEHRDKDLDTFIANRNLGAAVKMREDEAFVEYTAVDYELIREANRSEGLSEEMRVLYVALTRPKTHLFITACGQYDSLRQQVQAATFEGENKADFLKRSPSGLKWILFALRQQRAMQPLYDAFDIAKTPSLNTLSFCTDVSVACTEKVYFPHVRQKDEIPDLKEAVRLSETAYPFALQTELPIKMSVSEVKGMREKDPEAAELFARPIGRKAPAFIDNKRSGSEVGNAVHKFMQFADFKALSAPDGIERELTRLKNAEFLSAREIELVDKAMVSRFINQPIFSDMVHADKLEKEKRFLFSMPACEIFPDCTENAPILLQGVLDCYFEKNGVLSIVDYKTDRLNQPQQFVERYGLQLRLYRRGLQQILGKKADRLYIYSFALNTVIEIS